MDKIDIIREIINHAQNDFINYFNNDKQSKRAKEIVNLVLTKNIDLIKHRNEIDKMIPDTNDDGSFECSYALNTGVIILNLIDYIKTKDDDLYIDSITLFYDTVDFKVQQDLEKKGNSCPTEDQIINHEYYLSERYWLENIINKQ